MHSRIFCFASNLISATEYTPINPDTIKEHMQKNIDYVTESDNLIEDIQWLEKHYKIKCDKTKNIYIINFSELRPILKTEIHRRIQTIKDKLSTDTNYTPEYLWNIAYIAYLNLGFFFYDIESTYMYRDIELLELNENIKEIHIVDSFDYHF